MNGSRRVLASSELVPETLWPSFEDSTCMHQLFFFSFSLSLSNFMMLPLRLISGAHLVTQPLVGSPHQDLLRAGKAFEAFEGFGHFPASPGRAPRDPACALGRVPRICRICDSLVGLVAFGSASHAAAFGSFYSPGCLVALSAGGRAPARPGTSRRTGRAFSCDAARPGACETGHR